MFRKPRNTFYAVPPIDLPPPRAIRTPVVLAVGEGGRYRLQERIGRGSFGSVYLGFDQRSIGRRGVAIKLEPIDCDRPQLLYEYKVYRLLSAEGSPWVPKMYWYGQDGDYNVLVMELLGSSLQKLWEPKQRLPIDYVLRIAPKMIQRLELCHSNGILHRDVKPDNFITAPKDMEQIYLIDFGLSKSYLKNGGHIPFRTGKGLIGTARFCGINVHLGYEQSRRDDLEAVVYVLVFLCRGSLPWQGVGGGTTREERNQQIGIAKRGCEPSDLCRGLPALESLLLYARGLEFDQEPDYLHCRALFD